MTTKAEVFATLVPVQRSVFWHSKRELHYVIAAVEHQRVYVMVLERGHDFLQFKLEVWWKMIRVGAVKRVYDCELMEMSYDEAKAEIFAVLVPKPGDTFHYGGQWTGYPLEVWEVQRVEDLRVFAYFWDCAYPVLLQSFSLTLWWTTLNTGILRHHDLRRGQGSGF